MQAKLSGKAPFSQYSSLPGLNVVWGNPADPAAIPSGWFDVVYDNNGKDMEACQPLIDHFQVKPAGLRAVAWASQRVASCCLG